MTSRSLRSTSSGWTTGTWTRRLTTWSRDRTNHDRHVAPHRCHDDQTVSFWGENPPCCWKTDTVVAAWRTVANHLEPETSRKRRVE